MPCWIWTARLLHMPGKSLSAELHSSHRKHDPTICLYVLGGKEEDLPRTPTGGGKMDFWGPSPFWTWCWTLQQLSLFITADFMERNQDTQITGKEGLRRTYGSYRLWGDAVWTFGVQSLGEQRRSCPLSVVSSGSREEDFDMHSAWERWQLGLWEPLEQAHQHRCTQAMTGSGCGSSGTGD